MFSDLQVAPSQPRESGKEGRKSGMGWVFSDIRVAPSQPREREWEGGEKGWEGVGVQ